MPAARAAGFSRRVVHLDVGDVVVMVRGAMPLPLILCASAADVKRMHRRIYRAVFAIVAANLPARRAQTKITMPLSWNEIRCRALWKGKLMIEHKSRDGNPDHSHAQAMRYFPGIAERDLPRYMLVLNSKSSQCQSRSCTRRRRSGWR